MPDQKSLPTPVIDYADLETDRQLWEDQSDLPAKAKARALPISRKRAYGSGHVFKQKRSSFWSICYWQDGKRHRESTNTSDRLQAERILAAKVADLRRGLTVPDSSQVTFAVLEQLIALDYRRNERRSWPEAERRIRLHVKPFFGSRKMVDLKKADIEAFIQHRKGQKASNAEVNRELACLSKMFSLAIENEFLVKKPPIKLLPEGEPRQGRLSDEDFAKLLPHLPDYLQGPITFSFWTSWRIRSEVLTLLWTDIDRESQKVTLRPEHSKNGKARVLPYGELPVLVDVIEKQWGTRLPGCEWVFSRQGQQLLKPYKAWRTALRKAGLRPVLLHDLRRSAVSRFADNGVDLVSIMSLSGHKDPSMAARYRIAGQEQAVSALRKLALQTGLTTIKESVGELKRKKKHQKN